MKNQRFGIEIEMTGLSRQRAAQVLSEYFGTRLSHDGCSYDAYSVLDSQNRRWKIMSDASISVECKRGSADSTYRVELVSPICKYEDIVTIQEIIRKLRSALEQQNHEDMEQTEVEESPYGNLESTIGRTITYEDQANALEIYYRINYGSSVPTYGEEFNAWVNGLPLSDAPFIGADGFCSPLGENWRSMVTSEFSYRSDLFTGQRKGHLGLDMGASKGTPIRAALD